MVDVGSHGSYVFSTKGYILLQAFLNNNSRRSLQVIDRMVSTSLDSVFSYVLLYWDCTCHIKSPFVMKYCRKIFTLMLSLVLFERAVLLGRHGWTLVVLTCSGLDSWEVKTSQQQLESRPLQLLSNPADFNLFMA
jgi:hypothetical protein